MKKSFLLALLFFPLLLLHAQSRITLDDIWKSSTFRTDYASGFSSMQDGQHYMEYGLDEASGDKALLEYDFKTGKQTAVLLFLKDLIPDGTTTAVDAEDIQLSPDETKAIVVTESEAIYRYSKKVTNYIYDLKTKKMFPLSTAGKQRLATFSPDGKKVVFMRDNNIFMVDLATMKETQVTMDGEWNKIINGAPDWVYEEEFAFTNGMFWSPDSRKLAFYRMDESRVKEFQMTMYNTGLYPEPYSYKYPKAGEDNSIVTVHIYDVDTKTTIPVQVGPETNQYIPRVMWVDAKTLGFLRMDRLQNFNELLFANASDGTSRVIYSEKSDTYLEVYDPIFLPDGKSFLWTSDMDGWVQVYNVGIDGKVIRQVTKGEWDITNVYGYDPVAKLLYYQSDEGNATQRDVYSIKLDGTGKKKLSAKAGTNDAEFSTGMNYYMNTYSNANTPYYSTLNSANGKEIKVLVDNKTLIQQMANFGCATKDFFTFKDRDGVSLNGWMIKPTKIAQGTKCPVLMVVYGGPGANMVNDAWSGRDYFWHQMLQENGYLIACVDNRGTEYRGRDFKKCTYGKMGKLESADQIDAAKYLGTMDYVDSKRIGIWGWSYGGYMASLCLGVGSDYFKCAIAVAPVTSWRFYDSIYTERYMGLPQDNAHGYDDFSPVNNVAGIKGALLLCHGTGDDNVHFQNSVALTDALIDANKQFDFYMYPDRNHGISGGNSRYHLYTKMTDFLKENL